MFIHIMFLIAGLGLLIKGANWLVEGASGLAKKYAISELVIGLTVVAFGTSTPELIVNIFASLHNHPDIILGNIIGSNNFNLFVILGIAGTITTLSVKSTTVWKEIPVSFVAIILLYLLSNDLFSGGRVVLTRVDGLIFLGLFILFMFYVYRQLRIEPITPVSGQSSLSYFKIGGYLIAGFTGLVIGGRLLITSAVDISRVLGISEKIIGVTIVAAGTSFPELATSVVAAIKKKNDIAVGNIIGSNIFNIFFIMGICSLIQPIKFNLIFNTDIYFLLAGTIFLFVAMFTGEKKKLDRWEAVVLLIIYAGYMVYLL